MSWKNRGPMYCRTCQANGKETEIYFDKINVSDSGKSIPMEKETKQRHQCQFSPYAQKQNVQQSVQQNREMQQQAYKITSPYEQLPPEKYVAQPQDYGEYFRTLETKLDNIAVGISKVMSMVDLLTPNTPTEKDNAQLREEVVQLKQALKEYEKQMFKPANQVQNPKGESDGIVKSYTDIEPAALRAESENEHVRRVMKKGEEEEELDLT